MTGWPKSKLGDLLEIQNGFAFSSKQFGSEGMPLIRIRDIKNGMQTETRYSGDFDERYVVRSGDLLIGMDGEFACYQWKGEPALLNQRVCRLEKFSEKLFPRFLLYGINKYLKDIEDVTSFATVKHLSGKQIAAIEFPTPPLSEQQRIVGILDQAFEGIAKAKANAERNLANSKELFANAFDDLLALRCQDAPMASLDSIADFKNGLNFTRSSKGEVIKIVGVADFKNNFWTPDELDEVQIEGSLSEAYELRDNDILVVRSNGNKELIGRCILARGVEGKTSHSGFTIRVRPHTDDVDAEYLTHFMKSSAVRRDLVASGDGANISSLNQKALSSIIVPLPPVSVQQDIVKDLSVLGDKIGQLTALMAQKSSAVDELRQSVLHQAFSGNL